MDTHSAPEVWSAIFNVPWSHTNSQPCSVTKVFISSPAPKDFSSQHNLEVTRLLSSLCYWPHSVVLLHLELFACPAIEQCYPGAHLLRKLIHKRLLTLDSHFSWHKQATAQQWCGSHWPVEMLRRSPLLLECCSLSTGLILQPSLWFLPLFCLTHVFLMLRHHHFSISSLFHEYYFHVPFWHFPLQSCIFLFSAQHSWTGRHVIIFCFLFLMLRNPELT